MKKITFLLLVMFSLSAIAQKDVYLTITHQLGNNPFAFNTASSNDLGHNFSINRIDYYLSKFTIIHDGGTQTDAPAGTYILAKGNSNVVVKLGSFNNIDSIEGIRFYVGVDAPTNNNDPAQWVAPHPLAPQSPSMHWGWTAGYRFVALEGLAGASLNTTFEMHGLGNANYFAQTINVKGMESNGHLYINLKADYNLAIKGIDVSSGPIDHGMDATDLKVLQNFRDHVFSPANSIPTTGLSQGQTLRAVSIYPNPAQGLFYIDQTKEKALITEAVVFDLCGREISRFSNQGSALESFKIENKGFFIVSLYASDLLLSHQTVLVN